jgi:four helix bundle protein
MVHRSWFIVQPKWLLGDQMTYKFEKLEVWHLSIEYVDLIYRLAAKLPRSEEFNLKSQIVRAATSISLNIAEGSTGQTNPEQARFLGMAIRSLIETVACQHLIDRRNYLSDKPDLQEAYRKSQELARQLQAFRKSLLAQKCQVGENQPDYLVESDDL